MRYLTTDEHRVVVERLVALPGNLAGVHTHKAGFEFTSLMMCFLLHSKAAAESVLALHKRFGSEWFPATTGYVVVRSLFEVDVTAHYISAEPAARSRRYIDYEHVIRKNTLEAIERHRASPKSSWREAMQVMYTNEYAPSKAKIEADYDSVRATFENAKGKPANSWSGKSIYAMAKEVDHLEAYELFYTDLSDFTHVNVKMANRFLRLDGLKTGGPVWTQRADGSDVANVFRYAATFLTCFLKLFGEQFGTWDAVKVMACWDFPEEMNRHPSNLPQKPK